MKFVYIALVMSLCAGEASARRNSTITFGTSSELVSGSAPKRSFQNDLLALAKAHDSWKKAHLNTSLYACQHNSERVAVLAKKVADKVETAKNQALKEGKAVEKILAEAVGEKANANELPTEWTAEESAKLQAKLKTIQSAHKKGEVLEHLASQVMKFYANDVPRTPIAGSNCEIRYPVALQQGLKASEQYHSDTLAVKQKLDQLVRAAQTALLDRSPSQLVAGLK